MNNKATRIALVGCGYVADYYMATISSYPQLTITGVFDIDHQRLKAFTDYYSLKAYQSFSELLEDSSVEIVVNLTNPRAHFEISRQCLEANKHVYSEKPLAMDFAEAKLLVDTAKQRGLQIFSAPCSVLSQTAQTLKQAVTDKLCGEVRLVYAELDDGMLHRMPYQSWQSESGAPWPYKDEFEVGCTLEHAGYYLAWLIAIFGSVRQVVGFSDCLIKNKNTEQALQPADTADMSIGILQFDSGVVARLTTTVIAPVNRSIKVIGDNGLLEVKDCWDNHGNVSVQKLMRIRRKTFLSPFKRKVKPVSSSAVKTKNKGGTQMDFLLGVDDLAKSIGDPATAQLSTDFGLHVNEVALALQYAGENGTVYLTKSRLNVA